MEISTVTVLDSLIGDALVRGASDIHIDPGENDVRVRLRVDGILKDCTLLSKHIHNQFISRIKILSRLRTDEHHATQDGRFRFTQTNKKFADIRVSIMPTFHGENAVLRILHDNAHASDISSLELCKENETLIRKAISKPSGMILVTGPTGSGKTTTLYTLLKELHNSETSIVTIEDPIEYAMSGIEQIQTNDRTGLTFANGLRSILRQDPNVIMVGEIRDSATAAIAVNAALTGHLLLSTLHTNDAATTLPRLIDMGVEPFLLASTISLAISQRLVRKLCSHCKRRSKKFFTANGCSACIGGYSGRVIVTEMLSISQTIREAIIRRASANEIRNIAIANGMKTITDDALYKATLGITSLEEVSRISHD